ncbi:MAG: cytochrome c peroxidase [Lysobacteraceae bacterium]
MYRHSSRIHPALVVLLALAGLVGHASGQPAPSPFAPLGSSPVPPENPQTQAKVDLGFALFWDEQLSRTGTVACGSCHMPRAGGSDPRLPAGVANSRHPGPDNVFGTADDSIGTAGVPRHDADGRYLASPIFGLRPQVGTRQAISSINAGFVGNLNWDGRAGNVFRDPDTGQVIIQPPIPNAPNVPAGALEHQALDPLVNTQEMAHEGGTLADMAARVAAAVPLALARNIPADVAGRLGQRRYPALFEAAFGSPGVGPARIGMALAAYQRTLVSNQTPHDLNLGGQTNAMTPAEIEGRNVFVQARCSSCHAGALLSTGGFMYLGVRPRSADPGRFTASNLEDDRGRMRVPGLRNVELSAPYMADGRLATLEDVVAFYNRGGDFNSPNKDPRIVPLGLSAQQQAAIVTFLRRSLTDPRVRDETGPFARPELFAGSARVPQPASAGTAGGSGVVPRLVAIEPPLAGGSDFTMGLEGGAAGAVATARLALADPQALSGSALQDVPFTLDSAGNGSINVPLPGDAALADVSLYLRVFVADPGASGGVASSNSVVFRLEGISTAPRQAQAITFANPGAQSFGTTPTITATSDSGLAVGFSSGTAGVCTITASGTLTFVAAGTCTIHADQAGNASFSPAPTVSQSFAVNAVVPGAPAIGTAAAGNAQATVAFTAPASNGGSSITGYTVTSSPGGLTGTGTGSPITVMGLTNGTTYTFTVRATNSAGTSAASAASNAVTPSVPTAAPVLRRDRAVIRENSPATEISVLSNDGIAPALADSGVLSIVTAPARGTASVVTRGTASVLDDAIRYTPAANTAGPDSLAYRVCFGGVAPCADSHLGIEVRPLGASALEFDAPADRGFRDQTLTGLRALSAARFDAHGLVVPFIADITMGDPSDADAPWGAGRTATVLRTLAAGTAARDWRVLVDARGTTGGDVDLYVGVDSNGNGIADAPELACSSAMSGMERCDLAATAPANGSVRYWVLAYSSLAGQSARLEVFETALDGTSASRTLVATAPGALAAGESFPVRLAWNDATFLPGQSRGGWLQVRAEEGTSLGWVPVRINRTAGEPGAFALESGVEHVLALDAGAAHERLYIDVPPGATQLAVATTSASNVDLYLARVDTPAASAATPTIAVAPARNQAVASAVTGSGNESLAVSNPAAGRWYVTPVNPSTGAATLTVRATVTAVAPVVRSGGYFNPQRSGSGLFLYPAGNEWAGLWYTYLQDGTPTWHYLQAAAPGANGLWRGVIYRSAWNGGGNRLTMVGVATITPSATDAFTFSYTVDGETGSEAYSSFSGACPTMGGAPLDISGHWFDPLRSGTGYSVQSFPDYEFHLAFGYDARGVPRFLVAERAGFGGATETLTLEQLRGVCPLCTRTGNPQRTAVGTLQRRIDGGTLRNITLSASYVDGVPGTWAANDAVTPLGGLRGCGTP